MGRGIGKLGHRPKQELSELSISLNRALGVAPCQHTMRNSVALILLPTDLSARTEAMGEGARPGNRAECYHRASPNKATKLSCQVPGPLLTTEVKAAGERQFYAPWRNTDWMQYGCSGSVAPLGTGLGVSHTGMQKAGLVGKMVGRMEHRQEAE